MTRNVPLHLCAYKLFYLCLIVLLEWIFTTKFCNSEHISYNCGTEIEKNKKTWSLYLSVTSQADISSKPKKKKKIFSLDKCLLFIFRSLCGSLAQLVVLKFLISLLFTASCREKYSSFLLCWASHVWKGDKSKMVSEDCKKNCQGRVVVTNLREISELC